MRGGRDAILGAEDHIGGPRYVGPDARPAHEAASRDRRPLHQTPAKPLTPLVHVSAAGGSPHPAADLTGPGSERGLP
jgi:hypothetical protein